MADKKNPMISDTSSGSPLCGCGWCHCVYNNSNVVTTIHT